MSRGDELAKVLHHYGIQYDSSCKIVCPFHDDINPSMKLDFETGTFYCFGCNISGDAFSFTRRVEKIEDDLQAYKAYVKILNSDEVKKISASHFRATKHSSRQSLMEAMDYYFALSKTDWSKEHSAEIVYMKQRGFGFNVMNSCGAKLNINEAYPIIFPMLDNGAFRGWVCRTTNKNVETKRKYLYNTGFSRATTLCGDYRSRTVVIVEGYMDKLKFNQYGVKHVAAILGWKITAQQIEKLKNAGVKNIISALDNDKYGRAGTAYLSKFFNVIKFAYPAGIKDAGEMSKSQFETAIKSTKRRIKQNGFSRRN